ncbi:cadmium resistance protein CadD (predicted permease) [Nesterenkonia lacusekhoensis]|uniref:Cadmium resistance protein CadD (Predicted permease) n=1 Tax=Nesterenkonia lacusekhoensis TaxID=150832 RepID=A0ABS4T105_9MICC|nr:cadmium resistance protein CadD (predicted permease) [Nesterenkonia lacusekhoensis]
MTVAAQALALFVATNIDDIIVLSLFFGRGRGQPGTTRRILLGQYVGFIGILGTAVVVALGAQVMLPEEVLPYFGLIPLGLGLWAAWRTWRNRDEKDDDEAQLEGKRVSVGTVALVTFANGGDNIGVYVPVFVSLSWAAVLAFCIVFLSLVALLVLAAKWITSRKPIAEVLERWESILFPLVLITLGVIILVTGGAFGL